MNVSVIVLFFYLGIEMRCMVFCVIDVEAVPLRKYVDSSYSVCLRRGCDVIWSKRFDCEYDKASVLSKIIVLLLLRWDRI